VKTEHGLAPQQSLQWNDLAVSGYEDRFLSQLVQPGSRAFTIQIPQQYMSVHLIRPGDYVDIVGVVQEANEQSSSVLLQKILVLAVNEATAPHEQGITNSQLLTLSLTIQETQTLALALQRGPVMPALRSDVETGTVQSIPGVKTVIAREARVRAPVAVAGPVGPQPLH
jgi:pilus assembly protein CpaB